MSAAGTPDVPTCTAPERLLLPWVVTGRLAHDDSERVDRHLRSCADCRRALEQERALAAMVEVEDTVAYAPSASLNAFMARLDAEPAAANSARRRRVRVRPMLLGAVAVQALVIAGLAALLFVRPPVAEYTTLSRAAPSAGGARLHIVFAPATTTAEVAMLLGEAGVRIVDGPGESDVYTLAVQPGREARAALVRLDRDPRVRFVTAVAGRSP